MSNRSVLVTAGGSGIGLAIAEIFHERGDRVIVCDVDQGALDRLGENRPGITTSLTDVADPVAVAAMIDRVGPISVLVNNAGVAGPIGALEDNDPEDWARCFAVNVHGAFHMMRAVVPAMRAAKGGVIVNISTASTVTGLPGRSAYIASKWALEGLTKNAAREFGPAGIRVNAIRPGFMDTERMRGLMARASERRNVPVAEVEAEALGYISLRTKIQPSEIGEMAWFLASDTARHITAQIIGVDGNSEWEG